MTQPPPTREELIQQDIHDLHRLGYAQQLFREMGGFSNFAISFSIISILTGAVLLYGYGLKFAGPIINSVGWPLVSAFTLCVAASMAELASAYPTAGGLYFWAFRLGGRTGDLSLCRRLFRDHFDQCHHALSRLHVPHLSQLAKQATGTR
jgi:hypothetical protein